MGSFDRTSGSPRRIRRLLPLMVALLALVAGSYGFWLQYPAAKVGQACDGVLPVDSVLGLSGKTRWSLFGSSFEDSSQKSDQVDASPAGLEEHCRAGNAYVNIETAVDATAQYGTYSFQKQQDALPVPLGAGWNGFMDTDGGGAASVLLDCANWTRQDGSGILVTISTWEFKNTPDMRLKLARAVTETAESVAGQAGCETKFGSTRKLAAPDAAATTKPANEATGTCEGTSSTSKVRETDAGTSPVEECLLIDGLQLSAEYGPYNAVYSTTGDEYGGHETPSGADSYTTWTSANCKGAFGIAYYSAMPAEDADRVFSSDPLTKGERADLQHFAEQSAARHGCDTPTTLS